MNVAMMRVMIPIKVLALMARDPRDSRAWRALRIKALNRDGHTCGYCGQAADTVDHIVPVASNPEMALSLDNLISACKSCNSAKGSRSHGVFLARKLAPPIFPDYLSPMRSEIPEDNPFSTKPVEN